MTDITYKFAPVSEVIFGVTFKDGLLGRDNFYFKFISRLIDSYPTYQVHAPLFNEELKGFQNNLNTNPSATGHVLYRLRSEDGSWLVQIQLNKIYLNWVRDDQKSPGQYPGYTTIFKRFNLLIKEIFNSTKATESDILYCELSYHDRIRWNEYVDTLEDIDEIVAYSFPRLEVDDEDGIEIVNFTKSLNAKFPKLGGFMTFNFGSSTEITGKQILGLELSIKGKLGGKLNSFTEWFNEAHLTQVSLFEKFINPQYLEKWKQ